MAKPMTIPLSEDLEAPILYEDRAVLAIDKPVGWMLAPEKWQRTRRNLQRTLTASLRAGDYWAASRALRFIRFVHRLDAETSGVLLFAKSPGALSVLSKLFETRQVSKKYLAVVRAVPRDAEWTCRLKLSDELDDAGRIRVDEQNGKPAETFFRVLKKTDDKALVEARPVTGRTHQIRVHLQAAGHPVAGDVLYGGGAGTLALRAIELEYRDPFRGAPVRISAPIETFLRCYWSRS